MVFFHFQVTPTVSFSGSYAFGSAINPYFCKAEGILGQQLKGLENGIRTVVLFLAMAVILFLL